MSETDIKTLRDIRDRFYELSAAKAQRDGFKFMTPDMYFYYKSRTAEADVILLENADYFRTQSIILETDHPAMRPPGS